MAGRGATSAIAGLGMTEMTREFTAPAPALAIEAIREAIEDAGIEKDDVDGLLINRSPAAVGESLDLKLQAAAGLRNLRLVNLLDAQGSTAGQMVQFATLAIEASMANTVVCVFGDTPIIPEQTGSSTFAEPLPLTGISGFEEATYGMFGSGAAYAMGARRHMALYGTTSEHLGAVAVSDRQWACMNPHAVMQKPMTLEDHQSSRWIFEPLRLLDCSLPVNGAIAVVVTSVERARALKQHPVYVLGMGQGHPGNPNRAPFENEVKSGAPLAKETAFSMAGVTTDDVDICELYEAFSYVTLLTLEDYGFCEKGEGGPFIAEGHTRPSGNLPTNTGGGHLSGYYMQGMTPVSEAVMQARGTAGQRQVPKHDVVLVTSQGGFLEHHACLILSPHPSAD